MASLGSEDKIELLDHAVPTLLSKCRAKGVGPKMADQHIPTGFIVEIANEDGFLRPAGARRWSSR